MYPQNVQRGFPHHNTKRRPRQPTTSTRTSTSQPSWRAKRELWMQVCSSGDHQGTAHRNHHSPNRAATQVSMKYRVKRNQCQDLIHKPNQHSRAGQKMNRVKRYPTSGQGQTRHKPVHMPHYPPNSQDSHAVSIRYKVIPSDKRARTTLENQSACTAGQVCMREKVIQKTSQDL